VDSHLDGADGPWPDVTTIGLRNLAGVVHGDRVTLWATTSTQSASGDNRPDPNKVVEITDDVDATTLTDRVSKESFRTVSGSTCAVAYRGVAFIE
jgi:hypothetical protein